MEAIMKTFSKWASLLGGFFLLAIILTFVDPSSALPTSKNKESGNKQVPAEVYAPPTFEGPGWFEKIHGKNKGTYKYFKKHPENSSEWRWYGTEPPPYGQ
jgi:hypothetical protein